MSEIEVLNTLATMPPHSKATINGRKVERYIEGYAVDGGDTLMHGRDAARLIAKGQAVQHEP